jgi:hypothetical protein
MKMLTDRMIDCIEHSLPSGEYAIDGTLRFVPTSEPVFRHYRPKVAYNVYVECWDRRTGVSFWYVLTLAYQRGGLITGGDWVCYNTLVVVRQPPAKSVFHDWCAREGNLSVMRNSTRVITS